MIKPKCNDVSDFATRTSPISGVDLLMGSNMIIRLDQYTTVKTLFVVVVKPK